MAAEPALSPEVRDALHENYGIRVVSARLLGGEVDRNVLVVGERGDQHVVKVAPTADPTLLDWQDMLLERLARAGLPVAVPTLLPTLDGRPRVVLDAPAPAAIRVLSWLPGVTIAALAHRSDALLEQWGALAASTAAALSGLPPAVPEPAPHHWLLQDSLRAISGTVDSVHDREARRHIETIMGRFERVRPRCDELPRALVHQDLNDFNVLAEPDGSGLVGLLDVADARTTIRVAELAVAVAYAMRRERDPLRAAALVVRGHHAVVPLGAAELEVLFPLAAARLCVNAATWSHRGGDYGRMRSSDTWAALARIARIHPLVAEARLRAVCGIDPPARAPLPGSRPALGATLGVDLTPSSELLDGVAVAPDAARARLREAAAASGRVLHAPAFRAALPLAAPRDLGPDEPATVLLGSGLVVSRPQEVRAPLAGTVVARGPLVVDHGTMYTIWHGIRSPLAGDGSSIGGPVEGERVEAGTPLGVLAPASEPFAGLFDGMVQLLLDPRHAEDPPPLVGRPGETAEWATLLGDPATMLGASASAPPAWTLREVIRARAEHFAPSQRAYFARPMNLVRGRDCWLYDEDALAYLDPINNVTHVGHAEERVAAAGARQLRLLNTNSRFVYPGIAQYAERLTATLPESLDVVFFVCTGSEANDLALRIARTVTGRRHAVVIDSAYHGNTTAVTDVSPNRYRGPGGGGVPESTREVITPDRYRGPFGYDDPLAGPRYAEDVRRVADEMTAQAAPPAAFIAESLIGSGGNHVLPPGYLRDAFAAVRATGGLCISDEVQVGFGRLGEAFWGFETSGVVPDIVTMGKPMGNGHPMAAVVTTREIADAFDNGVRYFNTFGGNPVSCAIGMRVLDVIEQDGLQQNAREVGAAFADRLRETAARHPLIGDVRGLGLYLGVELVRDPDTREPAAEEARRASELLKDRGVAMYPNGRYDNVLKIKPPMTFTREHVDFFVSRLDEVLAEL